MTGSCFRARTPRPSVFVTLSFDLLKQFGVGLAAAVLIDATIIRAVLLPASMKLLGDWNWYLPSWLEWLPRVPSLQSPNQSQKHLRCQLPRKCGAD